MPADKIGDKGDRRAGKHSWGRILVSATGLVLVGAALSGARLFRDHLHSESAHTSEAGAINLSGATIAVLQHLNSPVEIRFYSVLDPSTVSESVQSFSGRVNQLLTQYELAAGNRITVVRCSDSTDAGARAASADGINVFNIDKGDSCFLGIAVACGSNEVSLARLLPEWEPALEADLTRAIEDAAQADALAQPVAQAESSTLEAVRRAIPNVETVSLEDGTQTLRNAALAKFSQAAGEMATQVRDAQQRFLQAQAGQSETAQRTAFAQLQKIQNEGASKLKQIALEGHAQIAALQQLKNASP